LITVVSKFKTQGKGVHYLISNKSALLLLWALRGPPARVVSPKLLLLLRAVLSAANHQPELYILVLRPQLHAGPPPEGFLSALQKLHGAHFFRQLGRSKFATHPLRFKLVVTLANTKTFSHNCSHSKLPITSLSSLFLH
jgi:hypothetical protein